MFKVKIQKKTWICKQFLPKNWPFMDLTALRIPLILEKPIFPWYGLQNPPDKKSDAVFLFLSSSTCKKSK